MCYVHESEACEYLCDCTYRLSMPQTERLLAAVAAWDRHSSQQTGCHDDSSMQCSVGNPRRSSVCDAAERGEMTAHCVDWIAVAIDLAESSSVDRCNIEAKSCTSRRCVYAVAPCALKCVQIWRQVTLRQMYFLRER